MGLPFLARPSVGAPTRDELAPSIRHEVAVYSFCSSLLIEKLAGLLGLPALPSLAQPVIDGSVNRVSHGRLTRLSASAVHLHILLFALPGIAVATDIYSSTDADGVVRWSTQAWDNSYRKVIVASAYPTASSSDPVLATTRVRSAHLVKLEQRRSFFYPLIDDAARRHGVSTDMVMALIEVESGFNAQAVSPKGARGLMQLMPATAARYGMRDLRELNDPARNLEIGISHLKDLLAAHGGQWALALASYNAGLGAVAKHGQRIPRYTETMLYVPAVLAKSLRPSVNEGVSTFSSTSSK